MTKSLAESLKEFLAPKRVQRFELGDDIGDYAKAPGLSDSDSESGKRKAKERVPSMETSKLRVPADELLAQSKYHGKKTSRRHMEQQESHDEAESGGQQLGSDVSQTGELDFDDVYLNMSERDLQSGSDESESGDDGSSCDSGSLKQRHNVVDLFGQLKELELEEKQNTVALLASQSSQKEKAAHARNQMSLIDSAYSLRILLQRNLMTANQLPSYRVFGAFCKQAPSFSAGTQALDMATRSSLDLLLQLKEISSAALSKNAFKKRKRKCSVQACSLSYLWKIIRRIDDDVQPFVEAELEKWWSKTHFNSSDVLQKKFLAISKGYKDQVEYTLKDTERLMSRTRLLRSEIKVLDWPTPEPAGHSASTDAHLASIHPEIFDDSDFYQHLLKDLIDARMTLDASTSQELTRLQLQALDKHKKKKAIDYKTTKGRKLRYDIHAKLANFMAPIPFYSASWSDAKMNDLYRSLPGAATAAKNI